MGPGVLLERNKGFSAGVFHQHVFRTPKGFVENQKKVFGKTLPKGFHSYEKPFRVF
jgi:hypothetical protein